MTTRSHNSHRCLRCLILALLVTWQAADSCSAGTIRADMNPQAYLDLGAQTKFASVGKFSTTMPTGSQIASGTLIAPDVVLTAAHVVSGATALNFFVGGSTYSAAQWTAYPLWNGNLDLGYDLAVVKLITPVLNVAPAMRYTGKSEVGMTVTEVGYGMTGTGLTGATHYDGQKRAGTNRVDSVSAGSNAKARLLWLDFDSPATSGKLGATALEYLTARGDSGGGLFVDTKSGAQLVGVSSFGYSTDGSVDGTYGEKSAFTRISAFNSWIDAMLKQFTATALSPIEILRRPGIRGNSLDDVINIPEPSSAILALLAMLGMARVLRRGRSQSPIAC